MARFLQGSETATRSEFSGLFVARSWARRGGGECLELAREDRHRLKIFCACEIEGKMSMVVMGKKYQGFPKGHGYEMAGFWGGG